MLGALGCNLAWGIIDALFHLMSVAVQKGRAFLLVQSLEQTPDWERGRRLFDSIVPDVILEGLSASAFHEIRAHVISTVPARRPALLTLGDLKDAGKIFALMDGRFNVAFDDIRAAARPALRHRLIANFEAQAEGVSTDWIVAQILEQIPADPEVVRS